MIVMALSYIIGAVNFAVIFSRLIKKTDIRKYGSGNPGTTNVYRVFGLKLGALTLIFDVLKGVVPSLVAMFAFKGCGEQASVTASSLAGLFAVIGHVFPVYYKFRGGKGVATSLGVSFVQQPILMLCCVAVLGIIILITDRMSVAAILWALFMIVWTWSVLLTSIGAFCAAAITLMFTIIIFAHRHNIVRLVKGKELPMGIRKMFFSKNKNTEERADTEKVESHIESDNDESENEQEENNEHN